MLEKKEIEFVIKPDGSVELTVTGVKGSQCTQIADLFKVLGKVTSDKATIEFYEQDDDKSVTVCQSE
ncbi:hypothetical protein CSB45_08800 [candidate division KSB3 bacterium]|uniref:DUF2997 domain-containing protein n=1 Tax=candidate division KSB3 bacterium TaxID=2044937 RepID=A0A2G6E4K4_9BACT|nr:MAG: hypothetical protein CSB45_08800 [candidate division KSB3 bacterium]PIE29680.1 MAG: hypothetical protein CSA57_07635 [candidate division KSB3 bacterium]